VYTCEEVTRNTLVSLDYLIFSLIPVRKKETCMTVRKLMSALCVVVGGLVCLGLVTGCRARDLDRQTTTTAPESMDADTMGEEDQVEATEEPLSSEDAAFLAESTTAVKNPKTLSMTVNHCKRLSTTIARVRVNSKFHSSRLNCRAADSDNFTIDGIQCRVSKGVCSRFTGHVNVRATCGNRTTSSRIDCPKS
jgi:hypothetical protein